MIYNRCKVLMSWVESNLIYLESASHFIGAQTRGQARLSLWGDWIQAQYLGFLASPFGIYSTSLVWRNSFLCTSKIWKWFDYLITNPIFVHNNWSRYAWLVMLKFCRAVLHRLCINLRRCHRNIDPVSTIERDASSLILYFLNQSGFEFSLK